MNGSDADGGSGGGGATDSRADERPSAGGGAPRVGEPIVESAVSVAAASAPAEATLEGLDRASRPDRISSVLVAVGPGPHSGATVDVARAIADATDAWLELFHVVPSDAALADAPAGADGSGAAADASGAGRGERDAYAATGEGLLDAASDRLGE